MAEAPRVAHGHDNKTLIVDHVAVSATVLSRGKEPGTLGIALDLEGRHNKSRTRSRPTLVIPVEKLGELIAEIAYHGSAASREFAGELESAVRAGQEKLLKEGGPR